MIDLTESAKAQLQDYFSDKAASPIRVYLADGGCAGPRLTLALDEPNDKDKTEETGGFTFAIDTTLYALTGKIRIDMTPYGFTVESENPVGGGGCSCSCGDSGCGSGSCSC
ncbi:IscA/HesB family protein [Pseudodesulfovibrio sp.]|uniref:IscA/HesB family protein n=1 Tax=Pseudodesulfovibrio sp. TaxID=2035812 RepID=UPI00261E4C28|nr:IscA/HesB family protein [Pseudodesulfovibrio sp.]MDD3311707.1 IscA/HesB family protein [Pseudodesulfovibrio sp.]